MNISVGIDCGEAMFFLYDVEIRIHKEVQPWISRESSNS
jgi:hypothetical protein